MRRSRGSFWLCGAAALFLVTGCVPAVVGGGIFVVGVGSALLFSGCDEPASVQVWDHLSSHPVCDATVTAVSEKGSVATFSPCYQAYLGSGTWTVTASKPGLPIATGTISVARDRKCNQPTFHSLELTLGSDGTVPTVPSRPPLGAPGAPPNPSAPPPPPPTMSTGTPVPAAAPSGSVPAAAFPATSPPVPAPAPAATDGTAPPTR
ncbi:MAG TPA: hypothetical protein VH062_04165 [Polyangiaceae bacterium]|jgi:hypothetical protein|nr:hypothetical protein [Polyangiaceae bacterium]